MSTCPGVTRHTCTRADSAQRVTDTLGVTAHGRGHLRWGGVQACAHCVYAWADEPDTWQCPALLSEKWRERRMLRKAFTRSHSGLCRGGMEGGWTEGQPLRGLMPSVPCTPGATEPLGILSSATSR